MDLLTTSEASEYLRLGERKLYELVADGAIPCTKVTGKWLFPREELDRWVLSELILPIGMSPSDPPLIVGGSQDGLLEWSLRESSSGLATLAEGTESGVGRVLRGEAIAAAIHFHTEHDVQNSGEDANVATVRTIASLHDAVLIGFVRREQGLLLQQGNPKNLTSLADVLNSGATMAVRQPGAGAQMLLDALLKQHDAKPKDLRRLDPPCLTGADLATTIRAGNADCGVATRAAAKAAGLDFVPLLWENFDLMMRQRSYFKPALQALVNFIAQPAFRQRANDLTGYDTTPAGKIRYFA